MITNHTVVTRTMQIEKRDKREIHVESIIALLFLDRKPLTFRQATIKLVIKHRYLVVIFVDDIITGLQNDSRSSRSGLIRIELYYQNNK